MIRITKLTDYGILVLTHLVGESLVSARELATATSLPLPTVGKLLRTLARAGLVNSQRGAHGGYELARSPDEISVADVIIAFEGPIALTECLSHETPECEVEAICPTRSNWDRINHAIKHALEEIPLSEMARPQRGWRERLSAALASEPSGGDR